MRQTCREIGLHRWPRSPTEETSRDHPRPRRPRGARTRRALDGPRRPARRAVRGADHVLRRLRPDRPQPAHRQPPPAPHRAAAPAGRSPAADPRRWLDGPHRRPQGRGGADHEHQGDRRGLGRAHPRPRSRSSSSFEGDNAARVVNNLDWTKDVNVIDFLRDIGKHFPVNRMLARDVVAAGWSRASATPSSATCCSSRWTTSSSTAGTAASLQTGGSDQWGNITAGVELIRRADGAKVARPGDPADHQGRRHQVRQDRRAARSGSIPRCSSPYAFYQSWIQAEDAKVVEYLRQFTFLDLEEIDAIEAESAEKPGLRIAQRRLAAEVTTIVHGPDEVRAAELASAALFGRAELVDLPESTLRCRPQRGGARERACRDHHRRRPHGRGAGRQQVRRATCRRGGWRVRQQRARRGPRRDRRPAQLDGGLVVLRKGKRSVAGAEVERA